MKIQNPKRLFRKIKYICYLLILINHHFPADEPSSWRQLRAENDRAAVATSLRRRQKRHQICVIAQPRSQIGARPETAQ